MWFKTVLLALSVGIACGSVRRPSLIRVPRETPAYTYHQPSSDEHAAILGELTRVVNIDEQDHSHVPAAGSVIGSVVTSNQGPVSADTSSQEPVSDITRSQEPVSAITSGHEPVSAIISTQESVFAVASRPTTSSSALTSNHPTAFTDVQAGESPSPTTEWPPIPPYHFAFQIQDIDSNNFQNRVEFVENGLLQGSFSLLSPDGVVRTSIYSDDGNSGFTVSQRENQADLEDVSRTSATTTVNSQASLSPRSAVEISTSDVSSDSNAGVRESPTDRGVANARFQTRLGVASEVVSTGKSDASLSLGTLATENVKDAVTLGRTGRDFNGGLSFSEATGGLSAASSSSIRSAEISNSRNLNERSSASVIGPVAVAQHPKNFNFNEKSTEAARSESPITVISSPSTTVFSPGIRLSDLLNIVFSAVGLFGLGAQERKQDIQILPNPTAVNRASNLEGLSDLEKIFILSEAFSSPGVSPSEIAVPAGPKDDTNTDFIDTNRQSSRVDFGNDRASLKGNFNSHGQDGVHGVSAPNSNHNPAGDTGTSKVPLGSTVSGTIQLTTDFVSDNIHSATKGSHITVDPILFSSSQEQSNTSGSSSNGATENRNISPGATVHKNFTVSPKLALLPTELSGANSDTFPGGNVEREFTFQKSPHITQETANNVASSTGTETLRAENVLGNSNRDNRFHLFSDTSPNPSLKGSIEADGLSSGTTHINTGSESEGSNLETKFIHDSISRRVLFSGQSQGQGTMANPSESLPADFDVTRRVPIPSALAAASTVAKLPIINTAATSGQFLDGGTENKLVINKGNQRFLEAGDLAVSSHNIDPFHTQTISFISNRNNGFNNVPGATSLRGDTTSNQRSTVEVSNISESGTRFSTGIHTAGGVTPLSISVGASAKNNISQRPAAAKVLSAISVTDSGATALTRGSVSDGNISAARDTRIGIGSRLLSNRRPSGSSVSDSNTAKISTNRSGNPRAPSVKDFTATNTNEPGATQGVKDSTVDLNQSAQEFRVIGASSRLFSNRRAPGRSISDSTPVRSSINNSEGQKEQAAKSFTASSATASRDNKLTRESASDFSVSAAKVRSNGIRSRLFSNRRVPGSATSDIVAVGAQANSHTGNRVIVAEDIETVSTAGSAAGRLSSVSTLNVKNSATNTGHSGIRSRLLSNKHTTENVKFARKPTSTSTESNNNQRASVNKSSTPISKVAPVPIGPTMVNFDNVSNRKEEKESEAPKHHFIRQDTRPSVSNLSTGSVVGSASLVSKGNTGFNSISATSLNSNFAEDIKANEGTSVGAESVATISISGSDSESNNSEAKFNQESTKSSSFSKEFSADTDIIQRAPLAQTFITTSTVPMVPRVPPAAISDRFPEGRVEFWIAEGATSVSEVNGVVVRPDAAVIQKTLFSASPNLPEGSATDATLRQGIPMARVLATGQVTSGAEHSTNEKVHSSGTTSEPNLIVPIEFQGNSPFSAGIEETTVVAEPLVIGGIQGIGSEIQDSASSSSAKSDSGVEQFAFVLHDSNTNFEKDIQGSLPTSSTSTLLNERLSLPRNLHRPEGDGVTGFSNKPTGSNGHVIQTAFDHNAANADRLSGNSQNNFADDIQFIKSIPVTNSSPVSTNTGLNADTTGLISGFNKQLSSSSVSTGSSKDESLQRSPTQGKSVTKDLSSISIGTKVDKSAAVAIGSDVSVKGSAESPNTAGVLGSTGNAAIAHFLTRNAQTGKVISSVHDGSSTILPSTSENLAKEFIGTTDINIQEKPEDLSKTRNAGRTEFARNLNAGQLSHVLIGSVQTSLDQKSKVENHAAIVNDLNQPSQIAHGSTMHDEPSFILIVEDSSAQFTGTTEKAERFSGRRNNASKSQGIPHVIPSRFSSRAGIASGSSSVVSNTEASNFNSNIKAGETIARGAHSIISEPVSMPAGLLATSRITGRLNEALHPSVSSQSPFTQLGLAVIDGEKSSQTTIKTITSLQANSARAQQSLQSPAANFADNRTPNSAVKQRTPTTLLVSSDNNRPKLTSSLSESRLPEGSQSVSSAILNHKSRELGLIAQNSPDFGFDSDASTSRLHSIARDLGSSDANIRISSNVHQGSDVLQGSASSANSFPVIPQTKQVSLSSLENAGLSDLEKDTNSNRQRTSTAGHSVIISRVIPFASSSSARNQETVNKVQAIEFPSQNFVAGTAHSATNTRENTRLGLNSERNSVLLGPSPSITSFASSSNNIKDFQTSTSPITLLTAHTTGAGQAHKVSVTEPSFALKAEDSHVTLHGISNSNIERSSGLSRSSVKDHNPHSVSADRRAAGEVGIEFTKALSAFSTGDSSQTSSSIESSLTTHAAKSPNTAHSSKVNEPTFAALVSGPEITSHNIQVVSSSARTPSDLRSGPSSQIAHFTIANHKFIGAQRTGQGAATAFTGSSSHDSSANGPTSKRKEQLDVSANFSFSSSRSADSSKPSPVGASGESTFSQRGPSIISLASVKPAEPVSLLQRLNTDNAGGRQHGVNPSSPPPSSSNTRNKDQLSTVTSGSQFGERFRQNSGANVASHGTGASAGVRDVLKNKDTSGVHDTFALTKRPRLVPAVSSLATSDASPTSKIISHGNTAPIFGRVSTSAGTISGPSSADLLAGSSRTQLNQRLSDDHSSQHIPSNAIIFSLGSTSSNNFNEKANVVSRLGLPVSITNIERKGSSSTAFPESERSLATNTGTLVSTNSHIVVPSRTSVATSVQSKSFAQEGINGQAVKARTSLSSSGGLNLAPLARNSGKVSLVSQGSDTAVGSTGSKRVTASNNNQGIILVSDARRSSPLTSISGDGRSSEFHKLSNDNSKLDSSAFSVTHGSGFSQRALNIGTSKTSSQTGISSNAVVASTEDFDSTKSRDVSVTSSGRETTGKIITSESNNGLSRSESERALGSSPTSVTSSADRTLTIVSNNPGTRFEQSFPSKSVSPSSSSFNGQLGINSENDGASRDTSKPSVAQSVTVGIHRRNDNDEAQRKQLPSGQSSDVMSSDIKTDTNKHVNTGVGKFATSSNLQGSSVSSSGSSVGIPTKLNINQNVQEISNSRDTAEATASGKKDGIGSIIALGTHVDNSHRGSLVRMQASVPKFNSPTMSPGLSTHNGQDTASHSFPANAQSTTGVVGESSSAINNNSFGGSRAGAASRTLGNAEETGNKKSLVSTSDISSLQNSAPSDGPSTSLATRDRFGLSVSSPDHSKSNSFIASTGTASGNLEAHHLSLGGSGFTSMFGKTNSPIAAKIGVPVNIPASFLSARSRTTS